MHDLRDIREDPEAFDAKLARRGVEPIADRIVDLDERLREQITVVQEGLARRNELSREFGAYKQRGSNPPTELQAELQSLKANLPQGEEEIAKSTEQLNSLLFALPNTPADDVPDGADERGNNEIARWGQQRNFAFDPHEHAELGPPLGLDFETAAAMSGARFAFLRGPMARLHRALAQFMLDFQTSQRGYTECNPPLLVRDQAVFGTGQLPKFEDDLFWTSKSFDRREFVESFVTRLRRHLGTGWNEQKWEEMAQEEADELLAEIPNPIDRLWLIPTAEVSLTNSVRDRILDDLSAPIRLTALTPCFRSEAGAAGKDTRGFIRQHQFEKVELVAICRPDDWQAEHEHMVRSAELVLEVLELPYRRMLLCAGDMGATAKKTFDLEVWLPGQGAWREISSVSWCGDYQARRMNARYRPEGQKGTAFVHTLNGSGLAVGRTLVAVLENYQQEDGSVTVPAALTPYMGGIGVLEPNP